MRFDVDKSIVNIGDFCGIRLDLRPLEKLCPLGVSGQHCFQCISRSARGFLGDHSHAGSGAQAACSPIELALSGNDSQQSSFSRTVATHKTDSVAFWYVGRSLFKERPTTDSVRYVVQMQHRALTITRGAAPATLEVFSYPGARFENRSRFLRSDRPVFWKTRRNDVFLLCNRSR